MKILVIGYGSMGARHAAIADGLGHEVVVVETAADKIADARAGSFTVHTNIGDGMDEAPHAIVIATPAAQHAEHFERVMAARVPVYIEKPLARSLSDDFLPRLVTAPVVQVGYNLRFHDGFGHMRRHHVARCGEPVAARFEVSCDMATWPGRGYADALLECSHELDLARWLLGDCVVAGAASARNDQVWEIVMKHANECLTVVRIDGRRPGYRRGGSIDGTLGTLRWSWSPTSGDWRFADAFTPHGTEKATVNFAKSVTPDATYKAAMASFLTSVTAGQLLDPGCSLDEGVAVLAMIDDARASAKSNACMYSRNAAVAKS